jgi:hypothetical protein
VLIRMTKALPAPLMDGFDVRGFRVAQVYDVENPLARYLIIAGYAETLDEISPDKRKARKPRKP